MRLEAIARTGGFENAFRGMFEDQAFFYNLFATSGVWIGSAYLERYRQRPDSWCHRMRDLGEWNGSDLPSTSRRQFLEWLGAHVETASITDADLEREWRRPMRPFTHPLVYRVSRLARRLAGPRARACED